MKKTSQAADEKSVGVKLPAYWTFFRNATPRKSVRDIREKLENLTNNDINVEKTSSGETKDNLIVSENKQIKSSQELQQDITKETPNGTLNVKETLGESSLSPTEQHSSHADFPSLENKKDIDSDTLIEKTNIPNVSVKPDKIQADVEIVLVKQEKALKDKEVDHSEKHSKENVNDTKNPEKASFTQEEIVVIDGKDVNLEEDSDKTINIPNGIETKSDNFENSLIVVETKVAVRDENVEKAQDKLTKSQSTIEQLQQNLATQVRTETVEAYKQSISKNHVEPQTQTDAPAKPARVSWTTRLIQKLTEEEAKKKNKTEPKLQKPKKIVRFPQKKPPKTEKREWPKFYPGIKKPQIEQEKKENVSGIKIDDSSKDGYACLITQLSEPDGETKIVVAEKKDEAHLQKVEEIRAAIAREECATSSDDDSVIEMKEKPTGIRRLLPQHLFSKKEEHERPVLEPLLKRGDRVYPAARPVHETAFLSRSPVRDNEHNTSRSKSMSPARERRTIPETPPHLTPQNAYYHSPPSRRKVSASSSASSTSTLIAETWNPPPPLTLEHQVISGSPDTRKLQQQRHYGEIRRPDPPVVPSGRVSAPPYQGEDYPQRRVISPELPRSRRSSSQPPRQKNTFQPVAPVSAQVRIAVSPRDANSKETQTAKSFIQQQCLSPQHHHNSSGSLHKHQPKQSPSQVDSAHSPYQQSPQGSAQKQHQTKLNRSLSPPSARNREYQNSPVQLHRSLSPAEVRQYQLQVQRSQDSLNRQYQNSPGQMQRSQSPADTLNRQYQQKQAQRNSEMATKQYQKNISPQAVNRPYDKNSGQLQRNLSPESIARQYQISPAQLQRSLSPVSPNQQYQATQRQMQRSLSPEATNRQYQASPAQFQQNLSVVPLNRQYQTSPRQHNRSLTPESLNSHYHSSPEQHQRSLSPASFNRQFQNSPAQLQRSLSPQSLNRQYQNSPAQRSLSPETVNRQNQNCPAQHQPRQYKKLSRQEVEALYWETQKLRAGLSSLSQHLTSPGERYSSTASLPVVPAYRVQSVQNMSPTYGSLIVKPQPVTPRARSVSPSPDRHLSSRSLSLPRDTNFARGTPQRSTMPVTPTIYEESEEIQLRQKGGKKKSNYTPIFKRGSLTVPVEDAGPSQYPKRVSFTSSAEPLYWPTRNGPAPEPPTRQRKSTTDSDDYNTYVNIPATMQAPNRPLPPVPKERKTAVLPPTAQRWQQQSESESGSEAGEVQRILQQGSYGRGSYFRFPEEEWGADGKARGAPGTDQSVSNVGRDDEVRRSGGGGGRSGRRDEPRRHTLSGDHHHHQQGGALARSMDLESPLPRGYPPPSSAMLFDDDPGIMSEVETSSTGFRRGGKQRSSLPVVRTPSKTLERPLGLVFLQYRSETKRALLPNEITSIDTVKALFVRSFPKQLTMEYLDSPHVKIYIHDSSKDMFYELEDLRSHLRDIRDRSVLRLFESTDMNGGVLPGAGVGVVAPPMWDQDQSYFSEPEFDSEYQHQHIHKTKASSKSGSSGGVPPQAPYYMTHSYPPGGTTGAPGASATLPRGGPLLRAYSPAVAPPVPADRIKTLPQTDRLHAESGYMSSPERGGPRAYPAAAYPPGGPGYEDPYYSQYASRSGSITPVIDEEASDTELIDESYSLYGVKLPTAGRSVVTPQPRGQFPAPAVVPYDATRIRVEHMERQLANLTGLVQKALTQTPTPREYLQVPPPASARDANYRNDDSYLRTDTKPPKLGKDKSVSFEKSVSFSDEPPDMNSPKQHSPQHAERTERDRHKPAPPPKPVSLSPGQYEGRHVYRDLQLTPEMYNQLRGLQKKAKDLRQEVRNLRRMSQAQAHSVRETIRDTFMKIRAMLLIGGEESWALAGDADKMRLNREEDTYKQEMLRLEKDLTELESTVEELRGNVINRKTRVNMSDVENMALILSKSSKTVADLKVRFPSLQEGMKGLLASEMEKVVREEKFLKEEPERLESALRRCKKLTGTLVTLKRLASVQEQRLPPSATPESRLSPTMGLGGDSDTPITPPAHGKPGAVPARGVVASAIGNDGTIARQRPENALDALLDELQTFARPPSRGHNPPMADIGRKGSIDSAHALPPSTGTSSLRRLHSYPSSSDGGGNSPPTVALARLQVSGSTASDAPKSPATSPKPPVPERNSELLSHLAGRRVPPPPPPRTSSRSPLASPTSPSLPPRGQHPPSQPQMGVGGGTLLRRGGPGRSSLREPLRTPLTAKQEESNLTQPGFNPASNSSSCESINSQEGLQNKAPNSSTGTSSAGNKARQEILEQRHQELLRKQRALQEQYARLQQLQRSGGGGLAVVPPPDLLLKKTGSESNLLAKMGLGHGLSAAAPISGSLTHLAAMANQQPLVSPKQAVSNTTASATTITTTTTSSTASSTTTTTTNKIYETDIL